MSKKGSSQSTPPFRGRVPAARPLRIRLMAAAMTGLLFLNSSPPLLAITMGEIRAGAVGGSGGGQGSAPNLQNAGASSAAMTAALAKKSQEQSAAVVAAMQKLQEQAAASSKKAPVTKLPNGQAVHDGLKAGWLEPYVGKNADGTLKPGFDPHGNPITTTWSGASITPSSVPANAANPNYVNIKQSAQNAYLYWNKFNVGPKTTVNFDQSKGGQSAGNWTAFNKVMSPSDPSHIFGNITAQGQVYILNQNGILFHNGSTVNTHALVASTLPINQNLAGDHLDNVTGRGIANNPDNQFLFSALTVPKSAKGTMPTFDPTVGSLARKASPGDVVVEKGAKIVSPPNAAGVGGLVALVGPNVRNDGSISTTGGQTILASGLQVALIPHPSKDPTLRGMDVVIGAVSDPGGIVLPAPHSAGSAVNNGLISFDRGSATIAGREVAIGSLADDSLAPVLGGRRVGGVLESSTSVTLNGRIDLIASYGAKNNPDYTADGLGGPAFFFQESTDQGTGLVELGEESILRILPEWESTETVVGSSLALNSVVNIVGRNIHMGTGSVLLAPGAAASRDGSGNLLSLSQTGTALPVGISLTAGEWFQIGQSPSTILPKSGQIYLESEAVIDASGSSGIQVDTGKNFVTLQLRGPELADSPLQRNSPIRGKDIVVDIRKTGSFNGTYWVGTPLGKAAGYANLVQSTVGELTQAGGSVSLSAGDSIVLKPGSLVNVSGGWSRYSGGSFATTKLYSADGRFVDIADATPDQLYTGIVKSTPKIYEEPYLEGAAGGSLTISAASVALQGNMAGITVAGIRQLRPTSSSAAPPALSSFRLNLENSKVVNGSQILPSSPFAPSIVFSKESQTVPVNAFSIDGSGNAAPLPEELSGHVTLSPDLLSEWGFGTVSILNHDGNFSVPKGVHLKAPTAGGLSVEAANILVQGSITASGGTISLQADYVPYDLIPLEDPTGSSPVLFPGLDSGKLRLESGAAISTEGLFISDFQSYPSDPVIISGGSIMLSGYDTFLALGSSINVSGGALVPAGGQVTYGRAGSISIQGGADPQATTGNNPQAYLLDIHDGKLFFDSTLRGFSGYSGPGQPGGSLALSATAFRIGGEAKPGENGLSTSFFNVGGFSSFALSGTGVGLPGDSSYLPGMVIDKGAVIHPVVASRVLDIGGSSLSPFLFASPLRPAASISLSSSGRVNSLLLPGFQVLARGDLVMEEGAAITVDPQLDSSGNGVPGSVSLNGGTVMMRGSIYAPGGKIALSASDSFPSNEQPPEYPQATLDLAPSAVLSAAGTTLYTADPSRVRQYYGDVLAGGKISLGGNIVAEGGILDVSGSSGTIDYFADKLLHGSGSISSVLIESDAGAISFSSKNALYSDALLYGDSGGNSARGGSVSFSLGSTELQRTLMVVQAGSALPSGIEVTSPESKIGVILNPPDPILDSRLNGGGAIALSSFDQGGFDSVALNSGVLFSGDVSLAVPGTITAATSGTLIADHSVNLSANHVLLGQKFQTPLAPGTKDTTLLAPPTAGVSANGSFSVSDAKLIDVGNLVLSGARKTTLSAPGGVIRGNGTLDVVGQLTLEASAIHPAGSTSFKAIAFGYDPETGEALSSGGTPGSITVLRSGNAKPPLSGGGSLELYANTINMGGAIFAPMGSVVLGGGGGSKDFLSNLDTPSTEKLTLQSGSLVSVSASGMSVLYGSSPDGERWIDPSGFDVTYRGVPGKSISLSAAQVITENGSLVDLSGGGKLVAPQWVSGLGGTVNWTGSGAPYASQNKYRAGDLVTYGGGLWSAVQTSSGITPEVGPYWSSLPASYAIIPGYGADYAPNGYSEGNVSAGLKIRLPSAGDLPEGDYTLLPSSFAALPGAFLISAVGAGQRGDSLALPDGSVLLRGTLYNALDGASEISPLADGFVLSKPSVLSAKTEIRLKDADTFFAPSVPSPKPTDGGNLKFFSSAGMNLAGGVSGFGFGKGVGARIDVSSPLSIVVNQDLSDDDSTKLNFSASQLSGWSFGSLLLGGSRGTVLSDGSTPLTVSTPSVTVSDGVNLSGNDIILAANSLISLGADASVSASGSSAAPDEMLSLSGNGILLRVSSDEKISYKRTGLDLLETQLGNSEAPALVIGDGALISAKGAILDSSALATVSSSSSINVSSLSLAAGRIALFTAPELSFADLDASSANALALSTSQIYGSGGLSSLKIQSYDSLDLYGAGSIGSASLNRLVVSTGEVRGFALSGGEIKLAAGSVLLENPAVMVNPEGSDKPLVPAVGSAPSTLSADGGLRISADSISLGINGMSWEQFSSVTLEASSMVKGSASGNFKAGNADLTSDLILSTPLLTMSGGAFTTLDASGAFSLVSPASPTASSSPSVVPDAGGSLAIAGSSVSLDSSILLPSGILSVTSRIGDLQVGGKGPASLSVAGISGPLGKFHDKARGADAGSIRLTSDSGNISLGSGSFLDLSAHSSFSGGTLEVNAPSGVLEIDSSSRIAAAGGKGAGDGSSFSLDTLSLPSLSAIEPILKSAGFSRSQSFRVRNGDVAVNNDVKAQAFSLSADGGSIIVTSSIDASGAFGGSIMLQSKGSLILKKGSSLSVYGDSFDAAGKGGSVFLSSGAQINGEIDRDAVLDLQAGSRIDLGVKTLPNRIDQFGGTLHLRAPQLEDGSDIQVSQIASTINGASWVAVEAYRLYDLTGDGEISSVIPQVISDAQSLLGAPGADSETATTILARLTDGMDASAVPVLSLTPGVEIINRDGDLTLANEGGDWDFSEFRTGANSAPGFLTLRASGDLALNASLSDGFMKIMDSNGEKLEDGSSYAATLLSRNSLLPVNFQSWSYQLAAGSDLLSADTRAVSKISSRNVTLGVPGAAYDPESGPNALTGKIIKGLYQVIRTGTGDISISASGDFQLRNQIASVYTAGTLAPDQNLQGTFQTPLARMDGINALALGTAQQVRVDSDGNPIPLTDVYDNPLVDESGNAVLLVQTYPAQFSISGGNVTINASGSIARKAVITDDEGNSSLVDDSVRELPSNWLYRRGSVDPQTGRFKVTSNSDYQLDESGRVMLAEDGVTPLMVISSEVQSTAWWVDFSNFFEGVGALGGGNVTMKAGKDVSNVDAVIPTQARMAGVTSLTVSKDTSLGSLAGDSGISVGSLALMNGIQVGMVRLAEGNTLLIPDGSETTHSAVDGDTIQGIADSYGVAAADLAAANNLSVADYMISAGEKLAAPTEAASGRLVETGGGNLTVRAANNIDAGVYYAERGTGVLRAGGSIITNPTRDTFQAPSLAALSGAIASTERSFLPTTLFLGKGSFDVSALGNVLLGPTANVFLMPQGLNNGLNYNTLFSTFAESSSVAVSSLGGSVTLRQNSANAGYPVSPILMNWYQGNVSPLPPPIVDNYKSSYYQPWLRLNTGTEGVNPQPALQAVSQTALQPGTLSAVAFGGDILVQGSIMASPTRMGNIVLNASGSVIGLNEDGAGSPNIGTGGLYISSVINLSDASPTVLPSPFSPVRVFNSLPFLETGSYIGNAAGLQFQQQLHDGSLLHKDDPEPLQIVARSGDLTGITLYSPKRSQIVAGGAIEDVSLYLQNLSSSDVSLVSAASRIIAYNDQTPYQRRAQAAATGFTDQQLSQYKSTITGTGDIQISGPGTLEVISGGVIDLGNGPNNSDGTGVGITSIGNARNPALPFQGANLVVSAGMMLPGGFSAPVIDSASLIAKAAVMSDAKSYFKDLVTRISESGDADLVELILSAGSLSGILSSELSDDQRARVAMDLFYIVLRDAGRDYNDPTAATYQSYKNGEDAIGAFFGNSPANGGLNLRTQNIRTKNGGSISIMAPGGGVSLASVIPPSLNTLTPPGIVSEYGGDVSIFTRDNVDIGIGRIFTLRGGDILMWSDKGNIAAGSSAKTVATAPPTRVLVDPTSGNILTDLAGLATGGGIGVLAAVEGVAPGNVDLIAPSGVIDAGDAGIRSTGTLNLAATKILNADNIIAVMTTGAPPSAAPASAPPPAAPPAAAPPAAANSAAAANNSASQTASKNSASSADQDQSPSIFSIDILGYGGGDEEDEQNKKSADTSVAPVQASL